MNTYNPYGFNNPYLPVNNTQNPFFMSKMEVTKVNGKNGVDAFQMPPNSSVLLLDESAPIVWLCITDGAGYKTSSPYTITPYQETKPEDIYHALDERIRKLEDTINERKSNAISTDNKQRNNAPKQSKSD